jgi:hypothetical protein
VTWTRGDHRCPGGVIAELRTAHAALRAQVVALEAANGEQARGIGVREARVAELERRLG